MSRVDAAASNIANVESSGALPGNPGRRAYAPVQIVQSALGANPGSGTVARAVPGEPAFVAAYDPQSPDANAAGLVAMPNVNLGQEVIQLASARQSYAANLKTVQTALSMTDTLLAIT